MNPKNTIISMIPQRWLEVIPPPDRDKWANLIVEKFQQINPELFAAMQSWRSLPEEERGSVENKVLSAADAVHRKIREERNASQ